MKSILCGASIIIFSACVVSFVTMQEIAVGSYAIITPTGKEVMTSAQGWLEEQAQSESRFLAKSSCAANVSKVLVRAGLSDYATLWAPEITKRIKDGGGQVIELPRRKSELADALNQIYGGQLPAGAILSGCYQKSCDGKEGSRHVAIIGEEAGGVLYIYHNNYYHPATGEPWRPGMVSEEYMARGIARQWMRTPFLKLSRNVQGKVVRADVLLPQQIGVLTPGRAYLTLAIPREIAAEIERGEAFNTAGAVITHIDEFKEVKPSTLRERVRGWALSFGATVGNRSDAVLDMALPSSRQSLAAQRAAAHH